jgi:hypothetical protein
VFKRFVQSALQLGGLLAMPLNEEQSRRLQESLESRGVRNPLCPFCGRRGWTPGDVVNENVMDEERNVLMGEGRPMVQLICNNCSYIALFAFGD